MARMDQINMSIQSENEKFIQNLDSSTRLFAIKELQILPKVLWEDERLEKTARGQYSGKFGLLVATNKRVIFLDKGLLFGLRVEDFPYDKITSLQYKTGLIGGTITIYASGNRAEINRVPKDKVRDFCDYIRARTSGISPHASSEKKDAIAEIERLSHLLAKKAITKKEYNIAKKKLLENA